MAVVKYSVDPDKEFQQAIRDAIGQVDDLTLPFQLITKSWFRSNKAIFSLKGKGKYQDLTPNYKKQKQKAVGFIYPILRRSGRLEGSITDPSSKDAVNLIINKKTLILGTKVPYGAPHQLGLKVPKRPFLLIGGEQTAPDEINRRRDAWISTLESYVLQVSEKVGKVNE